MASEFQKELGKVSATIFGNVAAACYLTSFVIPALSMVDRGTGWPPTTNQIATFVIGFGMGIAFTFCAFTALRHGFRD